MDPMIKKTFFTILIYWNDNRIHLGLTKKMIFFIWFPPLLLLHKHVSRFTVFQQFLSHGWPSLIVGLQQFSVEKVLQLSCQRSCYSPLGKSKPICWKGCSQSVSPGHYTLQNTTAVHVSGSTACKIRDVRLLLFRISPIESSEQPHFVHGQVSVSVSVHVVQRLRSGRRQRRQAKQAPRVSRRPPIRNCTASTIFP